MFTTINHPYQLKLNNLYLDSEVEVKAVLNVGRPPEICRREQMLPSSTNLQQHKYQHILNNKYLNQKTNQYKPKIT